MNGNFSRGFRSRPTPPVNLVRLEDAPSPLPHVPILTLDRRVVRWQDVVAPIENADVVVEQAVAVSEPMGMGGLGGTFFEVNPVILRIAADEQWGDVVKLVESATRHRFHQAHFAFASAGLAVAPRDSKYGAEMRRNAMDDNLMPWKREAANELVLARATPACPKIGAYFSPHPSSSTESDLQEGIFMASVAGQAAACSCEVDFDAIRAFTWFRKGRHWGPLTSHRELEIASRDAQTEVLSAPASMPWREAHRVILAARSTTPDATRPRFTLAVR